MAAVINARSNTQSLWFFSPPLVWHLSVVGCVVVAWWLCCVCLLPRGMSSQKRNSLPGGTCVQAALSITPVYVSLLCGVPWSKKQRLCLKRRLRLGHSTSGWVLGARVSLSLHCGVL